MTAAYIGLGANVGNREANMAMAVRAMTRLARVLDASSLYETDPVLPEGAAPQPPYLNAAVAIETGLDPAPLVRFLQAIEHEIGRRPAAAPPAPRPIDLDLLLYGDSVCETPEATVPHPRLAERAFVLVPLAEIAAGVKHPIFGKTIGELARAVGESGVRRLKDRGWDGVAGRPQGRVRI